MIKDHDPGFDLDSPELLSAWVTIDPAVEGDVVEYDAAEGLVIAKTGPRQWQATGARPLATYQAFLRSFRIKNDGPTVEDASGGYVRKAWFFVDEGSQGWGFRDIEVRALNSC